LLARRTTSLASWVHSDLRVIVQMVRALANACTVEEGREHDALVESHGSRLCFQFEEGLLLASELA